MPLSLAHGAETATREKEAALSARDVWRYRPMMLRAVILCVVCCVAGWVLVFASSQAGSPTGGLEIAGTIGGIIVYASIVVLPLTALAALVFLAWCGFESLRRGG